MSEVTVILSQIEQGDRQAAEQKTFVCEFAATYRQKSEGIQSGNELPHSKDR